MVGFRPLAYGAVLSAFWVLFLPRQSIRLSRYTRKVVCICRRRTDRRIGRRRGPICRGERPRKVPRTMPINIPDGLPAKELLHQERIFALEEDVAERQQIRPLKVVILNLMPTKVETETQILRLISKSPLQVSCDFMRVSTHEATHVSADHLVKFYDTFDALKDNYYDGFIVTGAPVEQMEFEDVDYWDEFCRIVDWSQSHVLSTMFLCWGALGALWHLYGIPKKPLGTKLFGVFQQRLCDEYNFLTNGFDEVHCMPHSRHAAIDTAALAEHPELQVLSEGFTSGPALIATRDFHEIYVTGHFEYGRDTLASEFWRDFHKGLPIRVPENYFPDDDPEKQPLFTWRAHANLLYRNWLNWVYQMTPYELDRIPEVIEQLHAGADLMNDKF